MCGKEYQVPKSVQKWNNHRNHSHNFCSQECKYNYFTGENSPNWIKDRSQLKCENRSIRESAEMKQWKKDVYERDNYTCVLCGAKSKKGAAVILNAHHIKRFSEYPSLRTDINNGVTLCESCHKLTYNKESKYEQQFYEILGIVPP